MQANGRLAPAPAAAHSRFLQSPGAVKQLLLIAAAIVAVIVLSQLLFEFHQWDRMQACASGGGRNCGGPPVRLER